MNKGPQRSSGPQALDIKQLLDATPDAMLMADLQGNIQVVNRRCEELFGYGPGQLTGMAVEALVPERFAAAHIGHRRSFAADPKVRMMGQGMELRARHRDGTEIPVEIALCPVNTSDGKFISAAIRDISDRKRVEDELRMHKDELTRILDTAHDAFISIDEQGSVTHWNTKAATMFGYTAEEALGSVLTDLIIPAQYRQAHEQGMAHYLRTGEGPILDKRIRLKGLRRDGAEFPIELAITSYQHGGRYKFNAFITDLTERHEAENLFQELLEAAPDAMVITGDGGVIQLVNAQAEKLFGYTREELVGKPVEILIPREAGDRHRGHRTRFHNDPHVRMMGAGLDLRGLHRDGHTFPVEVSLSPLHTKNGMLVSAAVRDITDRKLAETRIIELNRNLEARVEQRTSELLHSEQRFHDVLDRLIEGVQMIDDDWRYTYVNDAVVAQSGYTRNELLGHTMMELFPGIERTEMFALLRLCRQDGIPRSMENEFLFPNGRMDTFLLSIQPMPYGLFIMSTEISERKRAEKEVRAQSERLLQQNEELERFAYIASHDLQEPLRMISSYVELLQRRYQEQLDKEANEFIAYAVDGAQRMKRLIEDLLVYSRLGQPAPETDVDLEEVLKEVKTNLANLVLETGTMITSGDLPVVRAVHTEMLQVFQNLISNGIKFRRSEVPAKIHMEAVDTGEHLRISVSDNGIGIDMAFADQVFVPFKRLHSHGKYSGTGIGLAVVKKIVERLGGQVQVSSTLGTGSSFVITLPQTRIIP